MLNDFKIINLIAVHGCTFIDSVTISEPNDITASATTTDVSCFGGNDGTSSINVSGGTPPYKIYWGAVDNNNLAAGTYPFIITDSNACIFVDSITIEQPNLPNIITNTTDVSYHGGNNGTASVNISGGMAPYNITWGTANPNALTAGT